MGRLALYRKYRSESFSDVVGQEHILKILINVCKSKKFGHAYLFSGPRGVGKTTVARLFAKAVNDLTDSDNISDYIDIIEIDGASNRKIEEVRNIKENIVIAPTSLDFKVYIIDEVHMLTKEAFNALLKTLEEPPAHAMFIFATTDPEKLPNTILSRTQRFDFMPHTVADIEKRLVYIAKEEKIEVDEKAINLIAKRSKGGLRDAISMLDQLVGYEDTISVNELEKILSIASDELLLEIENAIKSGDSDKVNVLLIDINTKQIDPVLLTEQLIELYQEKLLEGVSPADLNIMSKLMDIYRDFSNFDYAIIPFQYGLTSLVTGNTNTSISPVAIIPESVKNISVQEQKEVMPERVNEPVADTEDNPVNTEKTVKLNHELLLAAKIISNQSCTQPDINESKPEVKEVASMDLVLPEAHDNPVNTGPPANINGPVIVEDTEVKPEVATNTNPELTLASVMAAVGELKQNNNSLYAVIVHGNPSFADNSLNLTYKFKFHYQKVVEIKNMDLIKKIIKDNLNSVIEINAVIDPNQAKVASYDSMQNNLADKLKSDIRGNIKSIDEDKKEGGDDDILEFAKQIFEG